MDTAKNSTHQCLISTRKSLISDYRGLLDLGAYQRIQARSMPVYGLSSTERHCDALENYFTKFASLEQHFCGVILSPGIIGPYSRELKNITDLLEERGICPGIRADLGVTSLPLRNVEQFTEGLYGLRQRLSGFSQQGLRFVTWRSVFNVGEKLPTDYCVNAAGHNLACFSAFCQEAGMIPVIEIEFVRHEDLLPAELEKKIGRVIRKIYNIFIDYDAVLEYTFLRVNIFPFDEGNSESEGRVLISYFSARCLNKNVPSKVPGIFILVGDLPALLPKFCTDATSWHSYRLPWKVSYSFKDAISGDCIGDFRQTYDSESNEKFDLDYCPRPIS